MGGKSSQVGPNRSPTIPVDLKAMMKNFPISHHPVEPPMGEMGVPSSFLKKD
jgi:hypothetical protein